MNPIYSNTSSKENKEFVKSLMNMNPIYSDPSKLNKEFIESFMNIDTGYTSSKTEERRRYEENVQDKSEYQSEMKRMMTAVKNHESFEITINDNSEKQYAFTQVLRNIRKMKSSEWKPLVYGYDMNGYGRVFHLNKELDLETMIRCILGEITVEQYSSDCDPNLVGWDYVPVRFEVKFVKMIKNEKTGKIDFIENIDGEKFVIESVDDYRGSPDGGFFPYINLIESLDLSRYQIYNSIDKNNYRDNCFVHSCVQSGVFTEEELYKLRSIMLTRDIPNKKILEIAILMKCHFVVYKFDDTKDSRHQRRDSVDTRKNHKVVSDRVVQLLTYKDHFMIYMNEKVPISEYYIEHKDELDSKFSDMDPKKRQLIKNSKGDTDDGTGLTTVLKTMFEHGYFREINQCEQGVLSTCEFDNHLNDYASGTLLDDFTSLYPGTVSTDPSIERIRN
ncbi:hypothetical protein M9Y10_019651 [Tritrichomonas musculus]|uniref:Initiator binding domain-containing protein n=1 Tax=Tritrichomonas musculus TaxID=1915356 RepID=A0ABR2HGW2_9EUKA